MTTIIERQRTIFRKSILPSFPNSKDRFERHFGQSAKLIKELPVVPHKELSHYHPHKDNPRYQGYAHQVWLFDLDVGLTALGVKPLALCQGLYAEHLRYMIGKTRYAWMLREAGLEARTGNGETGIEVYDPRLVCEAIRANSRNRIREEQVSNYLESLEYLRIARKEHYPHYILGYPEQIRSDRGSVETAHTLVIGSEGFLREPDIYYYCRFACKVYDIERAKGSIEARAMAAGLIEEIMGHPASVVSYCGLVSPKKRVIEGVSITRRQDGAGAWDIERLREDGPGDALPALIRSA